MVKCLVIRECPAFIGVSQRGREFLCGRSENYFSFISKTELLVKRKNSAKIKTYFNKKELKIKKKKNAHQLRDFSYIGIFSRKEC